MPSHQEGAGHHEHVAPHGGTLIELGEHQYQLEWVSDSGVGRLTLYVLDAHAENYVRIAMPSIVVLLKTPQGNAEVRLQAVGNSKTGETVGDTSQFEILDGAWKGVRSFEGVFQEVLIRGTRFHDVPFKAASANLSG